MKLLIAFSLLFANTVLHSQNNKKNVYCIHGQGSDGRLFTYLTLDTTAFDVHFINLPIPEKSDNMQRFARRILANIDTSQPFVLVGVSLGGMVSVEINALVRAEKVVIVSSAASEKEIPTRYRFMRYVPMYKLMPPMLYKVGAKIMQPLVEPDRRRQKALFDAMLSDKNPLFLKRATQLIVHWQHLDNQSNIVHIHGTNDHTLPIKKCKVDYVIDNGSHMMMLTEGAAMSVLINQILKENKG